RLEERAGVGRLHLLMVASANLESFLQDAVRLHIGALGHARAAFRLDAVGDAMARPVVGSSTVPDMLKYTEGLLGLDLSAHRERWREGYRLRCAAAHNGGVVTTRVQRELPTLELELGAQLVLDWPELLGFLRSADEAAASIDRRVASPEARALEARWLLEE